MSGKSLTGVCSRGASAGLTVVALGLCALLATPGEAIDLSSDKVTFVIDTTLSWGARYRLDDRDQRIIGLANGGEAFSVNGDDGNLNFDTGIASNAVKATIDVDLSGKNFGVFVRGSGFYDFELEDGDRERTPLAKDAIDWVGSRAELLDAYAWWRFRVGKGGGQLRGGQQVLNWGESTFIPGGISAINPVDVAALRVPGAELREAFRPVGMVWGSVDVSQSVSLEGFYQYDWDETVIDPPGTYFSTNDFAGRGGTHVFLGFGEPSDIADSPFFIQPPLDRPFLGVPRAPDVEAEDGGQYGAALRWLASGLGETEFGFYYMNYHSRLPTVNGISGTLQGALAAGPAGAAAAARVYQFFGVPPGVSPAVDAAAARAGSAAATDAYASTARYFLAYPEDIKLYGLSFNTQLGTSGVAFQGEIAYRQDAPYLVDDVELLFAALSPISPGLARTNQVAPGGVGLEEVIPGYRLHDSTQFQFTLTKAFGPMLGADQGLLLFEPAVVHVSGMPGKDELRYEGPGTYTSGQPIQSAPGGAHAGKPFERPEHFADATSWGYRLVGRLSYNNAVAGFNVVPRFGWGHDVDGVTPGPGGNFIDGRTALTLGLGFDRLARWEFDLSWTTYGGAGRYNLIHDRDFIAANIKYSF
jgi:hypothetical protein